MSGGNYSNQSQQLSHSQNSKIVDRGYGARLDNFQGQQSRHMPNLNYGSQSPQNQFTASLPSHMYHDATSSSLTSISGNRGVANQSNYNNSVNQSLNFTSSHPRVEHNHINMVVNNNDSVSKNISTRPNRDLVLEDIVYQNTVDILSETVTQTLKSVELANALRDRVGKDALSNVKVIYGGLLVLLELFPHTFQVLRIPKNDMVKLYPVRQKFYSGSGSSVNHPNTHSSMLMSDNNRVGIVDTDISQISPPGFNFPSGVRPNPINQSNHDNYKVGIGEVDKSGVNQINFQSGIRPNSNDLPNAIVSTGGCIQINNIPFRVTDEHMWTEFGGTGVVERVTIDFAHGHRSATIRFIDSKIATEVFRFLSSSRYAGLMTLHVSGDGREVANRVMKRQPDHFVSPPATTNTASMMQSSIAGGDAFVSSGQNAAKIEQSSLSQSRLLPQQPQIMQQQHLMWSSENIMKDQVVACDTQAGLYQANFDDLQRQSTKALEAHVSNNGAFRNYSHQNSGECISSLSSSLESEHVEHDKSSDFDQVVLRHLSIEELEAGGKDESESSLASAHSLTGTPFATDAVMTTLCDMHFVPGKVWPKDVALDYNYCQLILQIIHSMGGVTDIAKLKHNLKKRYNVSIRISPLKALLLAYPDYFQPDSNMNEVRALQECDQGNTI